MRGGEQQPVKFLAKCDREEFAERRFGIGEQGIMFLRSSNHGTPLKFVQEELRPRRLMLQTGSEGRKQSTSKTHCSATVCSTSARGQNLSIRNYAANWLNYCIKLKGNE
jgi:hypothetical protein